MIDPENVVTRLGADAMIAEGQGRADDARHLFAEAWARRCDHYEASIAEHVFGRLRMPACT